LDHFPLLILIGRPASGKSEIIDYLEKADPFERGRRFHVAQPDVLDDFPLLWAWFEEDAILEKILIKPRLHTDEQGYFKHEYLWHLLIERLNMNYGKRVRDTADYADRYTTIVEFSRGTEHGGYREAFAHLSAGLLCQAAVLFVSVSFEESLRKNRRRFNPARPDSILEHSLPDEKLARLYQEDDWQEFSSPDPNFLQLEGCRVPYANFENEDDVTSGDSAGLADRLETALDRLWRLRS
jgi:hypothetical protein